MTTRDKLTQTRMLPIEQAKLAKLAQVAGLTSSDIVRLLVREAYRLKYGTDDACVALLDDGRMCGDPTEHMDRRRQGPVCALHLEQPPLPGEGVKLLPKGHSR